jgi:3-methyl-2-oxobutanoate hydroxymethyltransferase
MKSKKITVTDILGMKKEGKKITALTAYDYLFGCLLDEAGLDIILVGDSCAMVVQGRETTLSFTMEDAIYHSKAVRRGVVRALLVADMPFLSYQVSADKAVEHAGVLFKTADVDAVKLEGGKAVAGAIKRIVTAGMPVMGHLGLTPQSIKTFGSYDTRAKEPQEAEQLLQDALSLQDAGAFALVLEKIPAELAKKVTRALTIPTIGIGAGPFCDGQILVTQDMLGIFDKFRPKFVRRYADLAHEIRNACQKYAEEIRNGKFPSSTESFND